MIRTMNQYDFPEVKSLLLELAQVSPPPLNDFYDDKRLSEILTEAVMQGVAYVSQEKEVNGVIFGLKLQNFWKPKMIQLAEMGFYVRQRNPRIGYALLMAYIAHANRLKEEGVIQYYTFETLPKFEIDYTKLGLKYVGAQYCG